MAQYRQGVEGSWRGAAYIGKAKEKLLELPPEPLSSRRITVAFLALPLPPLARELALPGAANSADSIPSATLGSLDSASAAAMASS